MKKIVLIIVACFMQISAMPIRLTLNNTTGVQLRVTVQCRKPGQTAAQMSTLLDPLDAVRIIEDKTSGYLIFDSQGLCNIEATQSDSANNIQFFGQLGMDYEKEIAVPTPGFAIPSGKKRNITWWFVGRGLVHDYVNRPYWEIEYTLKNPQSFIY